MGIYESLTLHGAEIKKEKKTGMLIVGFSSQQLNNVQLELVKRIEDDVLLAFYGCDLTHCDLSILESSVIPNVAVIYSTFTDQELNALIQMRNLKKLKIFDTQVTNMNIEKIKHSMPALELAFN